MKQTKKGSDTDAPQNITTKKMIPHKKLHSIPQQRTLNRLPDSHKEFRGFLEHATRDYYYWTSRQDPKHFSKEDAKDLLNIVTKLFKAHYPQNAQHLNFDFFPENARNINDEGLQALGLQLTEKFPKLRRLNVNFAQNRIFTHKGLEMFTSAIKNLNTLKTLSLDFTRCNDYPNKINEKALKALGLNLFKGPVSLCNLSLNFRRCKDIRDSSIKPFAKGIKRSLIKLQRLDLNFDNCQYFKGDGFETLAEAIATGLSDLKWLRISFGLDLDKPTYGYDYDRSDDSLDSYDSDDPNFDERAYADERIERSIRYYLQDKYKEREEIEEYLQKRLDFIPKLRLVQWAHY